MRPRHLKKERKKTLYQGMLSAYMRERRLHCQRRPQKHSTIEHHQCQRKVTRWGRSPVSVETATIQARTATSAAFISQVSASKFVSAVPTLIACAYSRRRERYRSSNSKHLHGLGGSTPAMLGAAPHFATKEQQPLLERSLQIPAGAPLKREGWSGTCIPELCVLSFACRALCAELCVRSFAC